MRMPALLLLLAIGCDATDESNPPPDVSLPDMTWVGSDGDMPTTMKSPTVLRVHYPAGSHSISVRGSSSPLNWNSGQKMVGGSSDVWIWSSESVQSELEWKPLLDDATWSRGPNYTIQPGTALDIYPHFTTTAGKVVVLIQQFHSKNLSQDRTVWVYLPASYEENTKARFPVVYMHDGQNLFDPNLSFAGEWMVDETMNAAAENGSFREAIVIGIGNTSARVYEYTPTKGGNNYNGGGGDKYLALLVDELKPQVDAMLRTLPDRENTAILGSSLGGLISAHAGVKKPETFGLVGAMSPSTWWDNLMIVNEVDSSPKLRPSRVYVDSGDSGDSKDDVGDTNLLANTYLSLGYVEGKTFHHVVQKGGQHNEYYWAQRLPGALSFLLGPR